MDPRIGQGTMKNERTLARDRAVDALYTAFGSYLPIFALAPQTKEIGRAHV